MKHAIVALTIFTIILSVDIGFEKTDIANLDPVQLVAVSFDGTSVFLKTDTDASGEGKTVAEALENLKKTANKNVFLDTADYMLVNSRAESIMKELITAVRPGCLVCICEDSVDLKKARIFLKTHEPHITLNDYINEIHALDILKIKEGKLELAEGRD